jgi:hypothetical protein
MFAVVLVCVLFMPMLLWTAIAPRHQWRVLMAWRYRDPAANEPSEASYGARRVTAAILVIGLAVSMWSLVDIANESGAQPSVDTSATVDVARLFQTDTVRLVPIVQTATPTDTGRVPIYRYRELETPGQWPPYVRNGPALPAGTRLVLAVEVIYTPVTVVVLQQPDRVELSLHGSCASTVAQSFCDTGQAPLPPARMGLLLVPIALDAPLGQRGVVDQLTGKALA